MCGVLLAAGLCSFEHFYFKYVRNKVEKTDKAGCCALISLSVGKSLTFRGTVYEASQLMKNHKCSDPVCDTQLWRVRHELDVAKLRLTKLQGQLQSRGITPAPPQTNSFTTQPTTNRSNNISFPSLTSMGLKEEKHEEEEEDNSLLEQFSDIEGEDEEEEIIEKCRNMISGRNIPQEMTEIETVL